MKNIRFFLSENVPFLVGKLSIVLKRHVFVMFCTEKEGWVGTSCKCPEEIICMN